MRLPQPGDAVKAATVLNDRMNAATGVSPETEDFVTTGWVEFTPDGITGPGAPTLHAVYGDLFGLLETMDDAGFGRLITNHQREVDTGESTLESALTAIVLQGIAFGVLMERLRHEG